MRYGPDMRRRTSKPDSRWRTVIFGSTMPDWLMISESLSSYRIVSKIETGRHGCRISDAHGDVA